MTDLPARILAAIEADEQTARAATPGPWIDPRDPQPHIGDFGWYVSACPAGETEDSEQGRADAWFIARHDPARVLARCQAARDIVALLLTEHHVVSDDCWYTCPAATEDRDGGETCNDATRGTGCDCGRDTRVTTYLRALAAGYGIEEEA